LHGGLLRGERGYVPKGDWTQQPLTIQALQFDERNPRLGQDRSTGSPRETITFLFETENAIEVAKSIATRDYFPNEPLLVVVEGGCYVVVEGNRRLAALKALIDPDLVEGSQHSRMVRVSEKWKATRPLTFVPCVVAPSRRDANRVVAGRHQSNAVVSWSAEDRAQFILGCLEEGYTVEDLEDELGFTGKDIEEARQRRAIVEMIRALTLPDDVRERVGSPRAQILSTIERVLNSSVGREFFMVEPDQEFGLRGATSAAEFKKGLRKLVIDLASQGSKWDSRTLNKLNDIKAYFDTWEPSERPKQKDGAFVPSDITGDAPQPANPAAKPTKKRKVKHPVIPANFKILYYGPRRIFLIHDELQHIKREDAPNSGAVLLRVFTELVIDDYLKRSGAYEPLVKRLAGSGDKLQWGPTFKQRVTEVLEIAKPGLARLNKEERGLVKRAFSSDSAAPFTLVDLHGFVHSAKSLPSAIDLEAYWVRAEPLFKIMLQEPALEGEAPNEDS
jgi:ParB-like chromosome segregation protein Spo0J